MSGTSSRVTGVRTVAVPVTDQDRAVAFYVDVLGLELRLDAPLDELGGRWIEVAPVGADTSVALVPARDGGAGVPTGIRLTTTDAVALHGALAGQGVDVGDLVRWPEVPPMFEFRDPDGNTLVVVG
jgi:lactoylglutathione lyase